MRGAYMISIRWLLPAGVLIGIVCFRSGIATLLAVDSCRSGLQTGQKPGPYAFVLSTGPQRGVSHCYICETAERPAIVVFARDLSDPLGKLAQKIDKALIEHKKSELRGWVTFLNNDQLSVDPKIGQWAQKH